MSWEARFISLAQLAGAHLGLGIKVGDAGHLDEFFLRLLEACDGIALPRLPAAFIGLHREDNHCWVSSCSSFLRWTGVILGQMRSSIWPSRMSCWLRWSC
jgi:hypothetical protein